MYQRHALAPDVLMLHTFAYYLAFDILIKLKIRFAVWDIENAPLESREGFVSGVTRNKTNTGRSRSASPWKNYT